MRDDFQRQVTTRDYRPRHVLAPPMQVTAWERPKARTDRTDAPLAAAYGRANDDAVRVAQGEALHKGTGGVRAFREGRTGKLEKLPTSKAQKNRTKVRYPHLVAAPKAKTGGVNVPEGKVGHPNRNKPTQAKAGNTK